MPLPMSLEDRVRRLEDIEAIRHLRNQYHAALNEGRYENCRALFTDDAVVELGYLARYEGIAAIGAGFRAMGQRERFFIKQFSHGHDMHVDGDAYGHVLPGSALWPLRRQLCGRGPV